MINFKNIEFKWQKAWESKKIFKVKETNRNKYYVLEMFPYPSASFLHMGHVRNYTIGDAIARYKRMNGFNVLYPMGYDSFGLPAENAAKKEGIHPKEYTEKAIKKIMEYQKQLGNSYDWDRVIATHEPEYFKWNQFFFLKFLEKGLVYKKKAPVNWCPECNSVLANEEVVQGKCWRHETTNVIEKELEQWFLKTTEYADELIDDLDKLEWSDRLKTLQKNWIGRKQWIDIDYKIDGTNEKVTVSTTRPDTNFGATFVVMAPEHPLLLKNLIPKEYRKEVDEYIKKAKAKTEEERIKEGTKKTGVFTGLYCVNNLNNKKMPLWVTDFVLISVGTGVVVGVPGHDLRDFEFAKEFGLPITRVVVGFDGDKSQITKKEQVQEEEGIMINSGFLDGLDIHTATEKVMNYLEQKKWGRKTLRYRLRDWLISRQRYWGTPIPIVYCKKCKVVPLKEKDLPLKLPEKVDFKKGGNPLNYAKDWIEIPCPNCKRPAKRETDTMGGFVDSSWYFLRYCSPKENKAFSRKAVDYWMPVDQYIGGIEHAVGHLIYSRFFTKVLRDLKMLDFDEPFIRLFNQGILYKDGHKMSKSFGNIITQTEISDKYGIDTARLFLMSVSSPDSDMEWNDNAVEGSFKSLQKIWKLSEINFKKQTKKDEHKMNLVIKNYSSLIENFKFNLATIELMKYVKYLENNPTKEGYESLLKMVSILAPHTAEELWSKLKHKTFVSIEKWPKINEKKIDMSLEFAEDLINNTTEDIKQVLQLIKLEKPKKIVIIISNKWKYNLYTKLKLLKTKDRTEITKEIMSSGLKEYGQEIMKILPKLIINTPEVILTNNKEFGIFEENKKCLEDEFKCKVEIVYAEKFKHNKSNNASPGKPAILVE